MSNLDLGGEFWERVGPGDDNPWTLEALLQARAMTFPNLYQSLYVNDVLVFTTEPEGNPMSDNDVPDPLNPDNWIQLGPDPKTENVSKTPEYYVGYRDGYHNERRNQDVERAEAFEKGWKAGEDDGRRTGREEASFQVKVMLDALKEAEVDKRVTELQVLVDEKIEELANCQTMIENQAEELVHLQTKLDLATPAPKNIIGGGTAHNWSRRINEVLGVTNRSAPNETLNLAQVVTLLEYVIKRSDVLHQVQEALGETPYQAMYVGGKLI